VDSYDGFIFDVYGCLFDGKILFENTRDLLINLKQANKKSVILSNSPKLKDNLNIFL
jgi:ribonucleotide monophosphatase NagD (HAD superfamily)